MAWKKVSDKRFQSEIDNEYVNIDIPFGKTELLFQLFCQYITADGKMNMDPIQMVLSMKQVGNILLTKFDTKGTLVEEGNCSNLSSIELADLFDIGQSNVLDFIEVISKRGKKQEQELEMTEEKSSDEGKEPKVKKTKSPTE